ncbi:GntR family transcriptional regulator [Ancylobacter sp. Lp-2]|uniref:FadR/GntR family transcriptional regulator n=1 Tax=Ancylobacter sp. Lp-2 TaxID=2881339 RepID=UPI001E5A8BE5|nr:GntR family transcriptional regulator [Ancylobacter sp. Lp-2]MCB4771586.1 GntR family transcriptional regulator [Ancylobacter sp. Lp-2]
MGTLVDTAELSGARAVSDASSHAIYRSLKDRIVGGGFPPGTRLPTERALAERFNAARNTVRKTMNRLVSEGLVIRHVGRGSFVADAVAGDNATGGTQEHYRLSELLEARLLFEPRLAELAVERATEAELIGLTSHLEALSSAQSWVDFKEAKYALHLAIARASKNRFLEHVFEQIVASRRKAGWARPGGHLVPLPMLRDAAVRDNAAIIDALQSRNGDVARTLICEYLQRTLMSISGD